MVDQILPSHLFQIGNGKYTYQKRHIWQWHPTWTAMSNESRATKAGTMRARSGQVLIEAAIVLPILVLIVLGIVDFGRAMYTKNTLNNAARAGARAASVMPSPLNLPQTAADLSLPATDLQKLVKDNLANGIPADKVSCEVVGITPSGTPVTGAVSTGDQVKVTLSWQNFPMMIPFTLNLQGTASMRYERGL
jgi:Flp pilus assembly protein TadG